MKPSWYYYYKNHLYWFMYKLYSQLTYIRFRWLKVSHLTNRYSDIKPCYLPPYFNNHFEIGNEMILWDDNSNYMFICNSSTGERIKITRRK